MSNQVDGLHVAGALTAESFTAPALSIADAAIAAAAAIASTKVQQQKTAFFADPSATTASTKVVPIHVVHGATGVAVKLEAGSVTANVGAATVVIDLLKNGTTILTAPITLDNANTARVSEAVTAFTSTALADGDLLELDITATAGGGTLAIGVFAALTLQEDPQ